MPPSSYLAALGRREVEVAHPQGLEDRSRHNGGRNFELQSLVLFVRDHKNSLSYEVSLIFQAQFPQLTHQPL